MPELSDAEHIGPVESLVRQELHRLMTGIQATM